MKIQAVSIGEAVPRDTFDAVIHSAFDMVVNLRLTDADRLITVLVSDHYELPQGIRIIQKPASLQTLTVGLPAACRAGVLRFDSSPLTIDLRGAPVWACRISELPVDMYSAAAERTWKDIWQMLNSRQRLHQAEIIADDLFRPNTGSLLSQRAGSIIRQLISSMGRFDLAGAIQAAGKTIGLGPGLTPSGDDILIGILAGLWSAAAMDRERFPFIRSFGNGLMEAAEQTNLISRTYLHHAAQGQFSSSLSDLLKAIACAPENLRELAESAMRVGHSSGMDSVTGLLIGLRIWNTEQVVA